MQVQRKGSSLTKRKHHHWKLRIIHAHDDVGDDNGSDLTGRSFTGEVVDDDMPTLKAVLLLRLHHNPTVSDVFVSVSNAPHRV